jgi:hypothetical protein
MKISTSLLSAAAVLAFPAVALAQADQAAPAAPPAAAAPAAPAAGAAPSQDEVKKFASAAIELNKIQADAATPDTAKQPKMLAAVQQSGLTPQRFNEIAVQAEKDPGLQQKIQTAASASQPAPAGAQPAPAQPSQPQP